MNTYAVGDLVQLQREAEVHRPPRRRVVVAVTPADLLTSYLTEDLCTCEYCDNVRAWQALDSEGRWSAGWMGRTAFDPATEQQGVLW